MAWFIIYCIWLPCLLEKHHWKFHPMYFNNCSDSILMYFHGHCFSNNKTIGFRRRCGTFFLSKNGDVRIYSYLVISSPVRSTRRAIAVTLVVRVSVPVTLRQSFICKFFESSYLDSHSSESIHIWTISTLEGRLSFHDSWPQGPGTVARSEACSLGMQAAPSSIPTSGTFFRGDLVMKTFLRPFSLFCWFKKSSCQLLAKECALSTGKLPRRLAQEQCG